MAKQEYEDYELNVRFQYQVFQYDVSKGAQTMTRRDWLDVVYKIALLVMLAGIWWKMSDIAVYLNYTADQLGSIEVAVRNLR